MKRIQILLYLSLLMISFALGSYILQLPHFQIATIDIVNENGQGSLQRADKQRLFNEMLPYLTGSFFNVNVHEARRVALAQPWIADAKVNRVSLSSIQVVVREHQAVARWLNQGLPAGLMAADGTIFQAPTDEKLPELDGEARELLAMKAQHSLLNEQLKPLRLEIERLQYDTRGTWALRLNNGVEVRLGKDNLSTRMARFMEYWRSQLSSFGNYIDYVDMRYPNAFAIRLNKDIPAELNPKQLSTNVPENTQRVTPNKP